MLKKAKSEQKAKTLGLAQYLALSSFPFLVLGAIAPAPSLAATLAFSGADFLLNNFSHRPTGTSVSEIPDTFTQSEPGSSINLLANGDAIFINAPEQPPLAFNSSVSLGLGEGNNYLGRGQNTAKVIGDFLIGKDESFSFDFAGLLNLKTSIDTPKQEIANATGNLYFLLIDSTEGRKKKILDSFILTGSLLTTGEKEKSKGEDFLKMKRSSNVKLDNFVKDKSFGGLEESASGVVRGSVKRYFKKPTNLSLIEVKENQTIQIAQGLSNQTSNPTANFSAELNKAETALMSNPIIAEALNSDSSEFGIIGENLSSNLVDSVVGETARDAKGSRKSGYSTKGDIKSAIAKNPKAKNLLLGVTQNNPILPGKISEDWQIFSNVRNGMWVDPPTSYGFEFEAMGDSLFTAILDFPSDLDSDNLFTVTVEDKILGQFKPGESLDFVSLVGQGVSRFKITGIDPLSDEKLTDFPIQLLFNKDTGSFRMKAFDEPDVASIPESSSVFSLLAFGVAALIAKRSVRWHQ
jgi:hypothetical protein